MVYSLSGKDLFFGATSQCNDKSMLLGTNTPQSSIFANDTIYVAKATTKHKLLNCPHNTFSFMQLLFLIRRANIRLQFLDSLFFVCIPKTSEYLELNNSGLQLESWHLKLPNTIRLKTTICKKITRHEYA